MDYSKAKVYTVRNRSDDSLIYVGSTIQSLSQRFAKHREDCRKGITNCMLHQKMRETDLNDWYIELYEAFPCNSKEELLKKEGEIIRLISTLNKNIAGRSVQEYKREYYATHKDKKLEYQKQYYEDNKEARIEYQKQYYRNKSTSQDKVLCS